MPSPPGLGPCGLAPGLSMRLPTPASLLASIDGKPSGDRGRCHAAGQHSSDFGAHPDLLPAVGSGGATVHFEPSASGAMGSTSPPGHGCASAYGSIGGGGGFLGGGEVGASNDDSAIAFALPSGPVGRLLAWAAAEHEREVMDLRAQLRKLCAAEEPVSTAAPPPRSPEKPLTVDDAWIDDRVDAEDEDEAEVKDGVTVLGRVRPKLTIVTDGNDNRGGGGANKSDAAPGAPGGAGGGGGDGEQLLGSEGSPDLSQQEGQAHKASTDMFKGRSTMSFDPGSPGRFSLRNFRTLRSTNSNISSQFGNRRFAVRILAQIALSWQFEATSALCILMNCALLGVQAHQGATNEFSDTTMITVEVLNHIFTGFFLFEFIARITLYGCKSLNPNKDEGKWNLLDAFLAIGCGVMVDWFVPLIAFIANIDSTGGTFKTLTILRAIRLARLVRVVRKVPIFREAWMLIRGLTDSSRTLLWTIIVVFFVTYTFAILGLVVIVNELQNSMDQCLGPMHCTEEEIAKLDGLLAILKGIDKLMFTLVQVLWQDSFHAFIRDMIVWIPWSWIYFYAYIAVACLVLMNLVTAIIVENAMETSRNDHDQQIQDKETKRRKQMRELHKLFKLMDADGSGTLSLDEFQSSFDDATMRKKWVLLDFQQADCHELFSLLDDGDGEIETHEFFEGLQKMRGPAQSKDVFRLEKMLKRLERNLFAAK